MVLHCVTIVKRYQEVTYCQRSIHKIYPSPLYQRGGCRVNYNRVGASNLSYSVIEFSESTRAG
jgi:hypothetical protein